MMFKIIFFSLCFYGVQSFAEISLSTERILTDFLSQMAQGKSLFCIENGLLSDGVLISHYTPHIRETRDKAVMNVDYTEVGRYEVNEIDFEIHRIFHKKPIQKQAQYSFQKTSKGLQIMEMHPADCLLHYEREGNLE